MRLTNSTAKKEIWNIKINTNGVETFNKNFTTLKEIAEALDMTYAQITDLKNKRTQMKQIRFKFYPEITITRINKTQKQYYNEQRELKKKKFEEKIEKVSQTT